MQSDQIRAVDLFCGAGGLSWGLVQALRKVAVDADAVQSVATTGGGQ